MSFAEIYLKGGSDKTVILNVRTNLIQGFQAPNWTDLRIGWFLSITDKTNDDLITGLAEDIGVDAATPIQWKDRVAIGLVDRVNRQVFLGYTNAGLLRGRGTTLGASRLVSSDGQVGTTNTNFWRFKNYINNRHDLQIIDGGSMRAHNGGDGSQAHLVQNAGGAGGYATLLMLRFQRPTPTSRLITMRVKTTYPGFSGDILYSNTPSLDILQTNLAAFPTNVQTLGPVELSAVPDAFYYQWPFVNSRLRIHSVGFLIQT